MSGPDTPNGMLQRKADWSARSVAWTAMRAKYPEEFEEHRARLRVERPELDHKALFRASCRALGQAHQDEFSMLVLIDRERRLRAIGWQSAYDAKRAAKA